MQSDGRIVVGASQQSAVPSSRSSPKTAFRRLDVASPASPPPVLPTGTLGAALSAKLPPAVIGGAKARSTAVVVIRNGTSELISGRVAISLYVSEVSSLSGATPLTTVMLTLKLKAGQSKAVKIKLSKFPAVPDGSYILLAGVTAPDTSITGAVGPMLQIAAPFVTIHETDPRLLTLSAAPGKTVELELSLQNGGNIAATGTATMTIVGSVAPSGGQTLAAVPLHVKLNPGASKSYRVKFRLPAGLSANAYDLTASLNVSALGDINTADGMFAFAMPLTVA